MRRVIAVAVLALAATVSMAQIRGIPPSVTSLSPTSPFSIAPPASVTSLGPLGFFNENEFGFGPNFHFLRPRFDGRFHRKSFPVVVPFYVPYPAYPLVYPTMYPVPVTGYSETDEAASTSALSPAYSPPQSAPAPAAPAASNPAPAPADVPEQQPTVLVFQDGHRLEIRNYAIVGGEIYNLSASGPRKIPLADLDLAATQRANDDRGVEFRLPSKGGS